MAPPLLALRGIHLTFGGTPLLTGADLAVAPGERVCLVGRNGSGKSTLLRIAAGLAEPDRGERFAQPGALVRYLPQEVDFSGFATTLAYVDAGLGPAQDPYRARYLLETLGLDGTESVETLSGGEARRAALARSLAPEPDVLLLDEPTNHLDLPAIEWLEAELQASRSALVLISHDRRFLENLSRATVWLDRGSTQRLEQGFGAFEAWRDALIEQQESERHKLDRRIAREESWMHGGVTARRKRNVRRVAELARMRMERREARRVEGDVRFTAGQSGPSGRLVIEATGLTKAFEGKVVARNFSTRIVRGDRIGIVGPNGAGKTTLLEMLTGRLRPDSGEVRLGTGLDVVRLDQRRDELAPAMTVTEALTGGRGDKVVVNGQPRHVASYMKDFLFQPEQALSPLSVLSGGERARLMLARALARPSNLLVLDEPTNDLDLETLELLQELLADYTGTVLLVSHDRDFLDRVVTSVIAAEADGRWIEYAGGYSDMLAQRSGADLPPVAAAGSPAPASARTRPAGNSATDTLPPQKRKLSFNEKHALATLPRTIEVLQREIEALHRTLSDPELYSRDTGAFDAATVRLGKAEASLAAAEDRWLELELLREELGGPAAS
ncbi:MAG: ATP-binding cassette domain-containing protein [Hyphomicrobiaceae bacterium]|nr:ATP-binding cassette domain-containing protein [Hyphomicrobiaceae bacterium]